MTADTFDDDISAAQGDEVEIVAGRGELPWTQVHDWVALSGVGNASIATYLFLKMHLNRQTGRSNPGTVRLATLLGLPRADKVAAVIRPLVGIGAVEVRAYGMPRRNRYIVHSLPPAGYAGPLTLGQWAKIHESEINDERQRQAQKSERTRNRRSDSVPPESGVLEIDQDESPVPPESGVQVPPKSGLHVPPDLGVEPDEVEPDEEPPPPSSPEPAAPVVVETRDEEEVMEVTDDRDIPNLTDVARDVLRRTTTGLPPARLPNREQAGRLIMLTVDALRSGWSAVDLTARLGDGDLSQVTSVFAVLAHRLRPEHLGEPPTPRQPVVQLPTRDRPHTMSAGGAWRASRPRRTAASESARTFLRSGDWRDAVFASGSDGLVPTT